MTGWRTTPYKRSLNNGTILNGWWTSFLPTCQTWSRTSRLQTSIRAIFDTIDDNQRIQCLILDISPEANLDKIFRPLENSRTSEMLLGKEKARIKERSQHASWLRIYAIKLEPGCYIITGGAIKLTRTMQEREHTLNELNKMEQVRNYLINNQAIDADGFVDFLSEL